MRWRKLRWCLAGVLGCALALPAEARVPYRSDQQRAREIAKQADTASEEGRKEEAIERYRAAWEIYKNPWYICDWGGLEFELDRARDAAESLSACARLLKPEDKLAIGRKVERMLSKVRAQVGELTVESNVPNADVVVDGKAVGKLPLVDPIFVDPGSHVVEVRAPGYEPDFRMALFHAGTTMLIPMRLEPMRVDVARPPLERVPVEPKEGEKPSIPTPMPLPVEKKGAPLVKGPVAIPMEGRAVEPERAPVRAAVILSGLGLSVAGAAVGAAGLMAAGAARGEAKAIAEPIDPWVCAGGANDPCGQIYEEMNDVVTFTAVGIAGFAASAVGGGIVVYELIRADPSRTTAKTHLTVKIAPGESALRLTGTF